MVEYPLIEQKKHRSIDINLSEADRKRVFDAIIDKVVFIKLSNGSIITRIVQFTPTLSYLKSKGYDITNNFFNKIDANYSGSLKVFKWNGSFIKGSVIENGVTRKSITKLSMLKPNTHELKSNLSTGGSSIGVNSADNPTCDYHVFYYYIENCTLEIYGDGMIEKVCEAPILDHVEYEEYNCHDDEGCVGENLTEECICQTYGICNQPPAEDPRDCSEISGEALTNLMNASQESDETLSIETELETSDTRTKKYQWIILKNVGWYLFSWELGVHEKTSSTVPTLQWKWQSFEHKKIKKVGVVAGGTVVETEILAIPTIGIYNAGMEIDFSVEYSVACKGSPFSNEAVYNAKKMFNVNDK